MTNMQSVFIFALMILVSGCQPITITQSGGVQTTSPVSTDGAQEDDIPWSQKPEHIAERKAAMGKGIEAAKREDWLGALEHFNLASGNYVLIGLRAAYIDPRAYYNLGLVYDRMGGHEFAALGNYRAYMALRPDAPNASAVKRRVRALQELAEANTLKLVGIAEQVANGFPKGSHERRSGLAGVAAAHAFLGNMDDAMKLATSLSDWGQRDAFEQMSEALALRGDFEAAKSILLNFPVSLNYLGPPLYALNKVGMKEAEANDIKGARQTIDLMHAHLAQMKPERVDDMALSYLLDLYFFTINRLIKNEDFDQASALLVRAQKTARQLPDRTRTKYNDDMVQVLLDLGQVDEAWRLAAEIPSNKSNLRIRAYSALAIELSLVGDFVQARKAVMQLSADDREFPASQIAKVEQLLERLHQAPTSKARKAAQVELNKMGYRPPGPLTFKYTIDARLLEYFSLSAIFADDWASFARGAGSDAATDNFPAFVRDLEGVPEFVMSTATNGILDRIESLHEIRKIERTQNLREHFMRGS